MAYTAKSAFFNVCVAVIISSASYGSDTDPRIADEATIDIGIGHKTEDGGWEETYTPRSIELHRDLGNHEIALVASGRNNRFGPDLAFGGLYYGYLQYEGFNDLVRTRIGRQHINDGAAAGPLDGFDFVLGEKRKWRVSLSAGSKTDKTRGRTVADYSISDYIYSASVGVKIPLLPFFAWADAGIFGNESESALKGNLYTLVFKEAPTKRLEFKQELYYDSFIGDFTYQRLRADYRPITPLKLYADYRYNHPRLSQQEISFAYPFGPNRIVRTGGEVAITGRLSLTSDFTTTIVGPRPAWRGDLGLSNKLEGIALHYGALFGESQDDFYGGFLTADVPRFTSDGLGAGTSARYVRYVAGGPGSESDGDILSWDVYGQYRPAGFFTSLAGIRTLHRRDGSSDLQGYLTIGVGSMR